MEEIHTLSQQNEAKNIFLKEENDVLKEENDFLRFEMASLRSMVCSLQDRNIPTFPTLATPTAPPTSTVS